MIPMAGNLQMVFYRGGVAGKDILVKFLLNEREVTLPISASTGKYYDWKSVKEYMLKLAEDK